MPGTRLCLTLLIGVLIMPATVNADDAPGLALLEQTDAFERAYAASYYRFDACGDELAGRTYRNALVEKLAQCPFSAAAKARFKMRSAAQRHKSREVIAKIIEDNGGLPVRLDGMTRTCREQMEDFEYRSVLDRLNTFSAGKLDAATVIPGPCDAVEITP